MNFKDITRNKEQLNLYNKTQLKAIERLEKAVQNCGEVGIAILISEGDNILIAKESDINIEDVFELYDKSLEIGVGNTIVNSRNA